MIFDKNLNFSFWSGLLTNHKLYTKFQCFQMNYGNLIVITNLEAERRESVTWIWIEFLLRGERGNQTRQQEDK